MSHMTNPLATPDQLFRRRSFGALPLELQDTIFFATQCLTQAAGMLLELPQSVTAQANVLLARYWLVESMMSHEFSDVSAAVLYLTAKVSPHPRSPRDLCNVYSYLLSPASSLFRPSPTSGNKNPHRPSAPSHPPPPSTYLPSQARYQAFRARVLALESRVLQALSFNTHVALPHPLAITYLQSLDFFHFQYPSTRQRPPHHDHNDPANDYGPANAHTNTNTNTNTDSDSDVEDTDTTESTPQERGRRHLGRRALAYLNAALLSPQLLYLTSQPNALAVAAVYAAARDAGAKMPACAWWEVFDVDREELGFLVVGLRSVDGWARRMRAGGVVAGWGGPRGGMLTRRDVAGELHRRGLGGFENVGAEAAAEAEAEAARKMDEKMAEMEADV